MAVKGLFVGIDKHQDEQIPELSGARRDGYGSVGPVY